MINSKIHTVFFDLDNTLIDSTFIKERLFRWAQSFGFSGGDAVTIYNAAKGKVGFSEFSIENFAKEINIRLAALGKQPITGEAVGDLYKDLVSHGSQLILPGAMDLIFFCKRQEIAHCILTLGDSVWQRQKIHFSGLNNFFSDERIIVTSQKDVSIGKCAKIKDYINTRDHGHQGEGIAVFNDSASEVLGMLKEFLRLNAFLRNSLTDEQKKEFFPYENRFFVSESLEGLRQSYEKIL